MRFTKAKNRQHRYRSGRPWRCLKTHVLLLTLLAFTLNPIAPHLAFARTPQIYKVRLPEHACTVKERFKGESEKTIIHIQDPHANVEAQLNIEKIINSLVSDNDVSLVGVEGASSEINLNELRAYPSQKAKDIVSTWYVEDGILSGAEKALITSEDRFSMVGVEDKDLFIQNYQDFHSTILKRDDIIKEIDAIEDMLQDLKTPLYGDELFQFDQIASEWENEKTDFLEFLSNLYNYMSSHEIEPYDYIHLGAMMDAFKIKSRVPEITLHSEKQNLLRMIEAGMGLLDANQDDNRRLQSHFRKVTKGHDEGSVKEREYLESLRYFSQRLDIDFNTFLVVKEELHYQQAFGRLDFQGTLEDVNRFNHDLRMKLAKTQDEKELIERFRHITLLRRLTSLQGVNEDIRYFEANQGRFNLSYFKTFIDQASSKTGLEIKTNALSKPLDPILESIDRFYFGAKTRDKVLVDNLIRNMNQQGSRVSAIVSGGFHTEGIVNELRSRGYSYMVVVPRMSDVQTNDGYMQKMMGQLFQLSPQMVGNITVLATAAEVTDLDSYKKLISNIKQLMRLVSIQAGIDEASDIEPGSALAQKALAMKTMKDVLSSLPDSVESTTVKALRHVIAQGIKDAVREGDLSSEGTPVLSIGRDDVTKVSNSIKNNEITYQFESDSLSKQFTAIAKAAGVMAEEFLPEQQKALNTFFGGVEGFHDALVDIVAMEESDVATINLVLDETLAESLKERAKTLATLSSVIQIKSYDEVVGTEFGKTVLIGNDMNRDKYELNATGPIAFFLNQTDGKHLALFEGILAGLIKVAAADNENAQKSALTNLSSFSKSENQDTFEISLSADLDVNEQLQNAHKDKLTREFA